MLEPEEDGFVYRTRRAPAAMDPAMRRMALGAGGLSLLVIVVALLWSGVRGTGFGPPPVITAPPGPLRIVPANPGGLTVPEANVPIMSGVTSVAPPQLAPGTPTPDISQLDQDAGIGVPPQPALKTQPTADIAQLDQEAGVGVPAQPVLKTQSTSKISHREASHQEVGGGHVAVQLASIGSEAGAQEVWNVLQQKMPDLLSHRTPDVIPAVVNGLNVWRVRVGGFANTEAAQAFCKSVQARHAACMVASF